MLLSSHIFCNFYRLPSNTEFRLCMLHVKMRRLAYSSGHVTIFFTDNANVCWNSSARTKKYKEKQYFLTVLISLTIFLVFLVFMMLANVVSGVKASEGGLTILCADIASSSIFPTDPCLLKNIWI